MKNLDYSSIIDHNPGIAGSEYELLLVPYLLELRENDFDPYLLVNFSGTFPHKNVFRVGNLDDCCQFCLKEKVEILVVDIKYFNKQVLDRYGNYLSVIIWAHNNVSYDTLDLFWELSYVKKIVNCGREELELYRDHIATLKSTYIYNIFPFKDKSFYVDKILQDENHNVVYMGSIIPVKSFHVLAKVWKNVLSKVPDAQLYVIGSGRLYDSHAQLGKYGVAKADYEDAFMPFLTDEKGEILSSVHFCGLLGDEKYDVLGKCKVAVPNPTGRTETFCICAVEMQLMGCSITTIKHPAYYDTVYNKSFLYESEKDLASSIVSRLTSRRDDYDDLYNYLTGRFGIEANISKWEYVLSNLNTIQVDNYSNYYFVRKTLKNILLNIKRVCPIFNRLMPFDVFESKVRRRLNLQ